jgi:hypothetical protein
MTEVKMLKGSETLASVAYTRDNDGQVKKTTAKTSRQGVHRSRGGLKAMSSPDDEEIVRVSKAWLALQATKDPQYD